MSRTCWWSETVIPGHYIRDSSTSCRAKFKTRDRIVPSLFSSPSHLPIPWVCSLRGKLLLHNYLPWVNATGCVHNRFFFMDLELCIFIFPGCCLACMVAWAGKILWLFCLLISSLTGFFFPLWCKQVNTVLALRCIKITVSFPYLPSHSFSLHPNANTDVINVFFTVCSHLTSRFKILPVY